jgi:hypothetical protein
MKKPRHQKHRETYLQKLRDPRWQKKRLEVFARDEWACQRCFDSESTLHVHHCYYLRNAEPWDYDLSALETLCETCHQEETEQRPVANEALLAAFQRPGIHADDIASLAAAFAQLHMQYPPVLSALEWVMENPERMDALIEAEHEEIRHMDPAMREEKWSTRSVFVTALLKNTAERSPRLRRG